MKSCRLRKEADMRGEKIMPCRFDCDHCPYPDCYAKAADCAKQNVRDHVTWKDAFSWGGAREIEGMGDVARIDREIIAAACES